MLRCSNFYAVPLFFFFFFLIANDFETSFQDNKFTLSRVYILKFSTFDARR